MGLVVNKCEADEDVGRLEQVCTPIGTFEIPMNRIVREPPVATKFSTLRARPEFRKIMSIQLHKILERRQVGLRRLDQVDVHVIVF